MRIPGTGSMAVAILLTLSAGCSSSPGLARNVATPSPTPSLSAPAVTSTGPGRPGSLAAPTSPLATPGRPERAADDSPAERVSRTAVRRAIDGGLGRFLGYVDVEPSFGPNKRFVGWRVRQLRGTKETWRGVDLRVGDVVTRINGFRIEHDYEAHRAFRSLDVASEIRVAFLRHGTSAELRLAIVEDAAGETSGSNLAEPTPKEAEGPLRSAPPRPATIVIGP